MDMNSSYRVFLPMLLSLMSSNASAEDNTVSFHEDKRHHVSILSGGTSILSQPETALTLGIDYEYRVNRLLGLGFVLEQAFGEIDATTLLLVSDLHIWKGLVAQVGPGIEIIDDKTAFAARFGLLYEFELDDSFTLSPQLHYDISREDSIVFGLAIGMAF